MMQTRLKLSEAAMANIYLFPSRRRVGFIRRQATILASRAPQAAENTLASVLKSQREAMQRRGIAKGVIESDLASLEAAIRAATWSRQLTGGAQ